MFHNIFSYKNKIKLADKLVIEGNQLYNEQNNNAYKKYLEASEIYKNTDELEYKNCITIATNILLKLNSITNESKNVIIKLIEIYENEENFNKLGELYNKIANLYHENNDINNAIYYYTEAINYYKLLNYNKYKIKSIKEKLKNINL
jgi:hypothetical protein